MSTTNSDAVVSSCHEINGVPLIHPATLSDYPEKPPGTLLHLTARIGLPLNYSYFETIQHIELTSQNPAINESHNNPVLSMLSMQKRPNGTVETESVSGNARPNILIARADGKTLKIQDVSLIWIFAHNSHDDIAKEKSLSENEKHDKFFDVMMTPEKFVEWGNGFVEADWQCPVRL